MLNNYKPDKKFNNMYISKCLVGVYEKQMTTFLITV